MHILDAKREVLESPALCRINRHRGMVAMGRVVGIDLGTTYSAVAVLGDDGLPEILKNADGEPTTPSVVLFQSFDGKDEPLVGTMAKHSAASDPDNVVQFVNWVVKETGVSGGQASIIPWSVVVDSDGVCKLAYRSTLGSDSGDSRTVVVSYIDDQSHKVMDSFSYYCDAKSSTVDGYLLSESDSRRYTEAEIKEMGMSTWELCLARNEIYARHGREFKNEKIQEYFDNKDWYEGIYSPEEFDAMTSPLNDIERANAETIQSYERAIGSEFLNP